MEKQKAIRLAIKKGYSKELAKHIFKDIGFISETKFNSLIEKYEGSL